MGGNYMPRWTMIIRQAMDSVDGRSMYFSPFGYCFPDDLPKLLATELLNMQRCFPIEVEIIQVSVTYAQGSGNRHSVGRVCRAHETDDLQAAGFALGNELVHALRAAKSAREGRATRKKSGDIEGLAEMTRTAATVLDAAAAVASPGDLFKIGKAVAGGSASPDGEGGLDLGGIMEMIPPEFLSQIMKSIPDQQQQSTPAEKPAEVKKTKQIPEV